MIKRVKTTRTPQRFEGLNNRLFPAIRHSDSRIMNDDGTMKRLADVRAGVILCYWYDLFDENDGHPFTAYVLANWSALHKERAEDRPNAGYNPRPPYPITQISSEMPSRGACEMCNKTIGTGGVSTVHEIKVPMYMSFYEGIEFCAKSGKPILDETTTEIRIQCSLCFDCAEKAATRGIG